MALLAAAMIGQGGPRVEPTATPVWAARAALADMQAVSPDKHAVTRYVWLRGGSQDELAVLSYVVNSTLSRVNVGIVPGDVGAMVVLNGGKLVRLDLAMLATDADELTELLGTWERLAEVETDFTATVEVTELVKVPKYKHTDGKLYTHRRRTSKVQGFAAHVSNEMHELGSKTLSAVPVIDGRELLRTALSTLEGGLYYEFRGIGSKNLAAYLRSRGASEEQVAKLDSLEKAVKLRSDITGKERLVSLFRGAGVRASLGGGLVSLTFDPFDESRDVRDSAIRNLLNFRGDGSEVIVELANGFHEFTLWDAAGKLVRSAPSNLASDHTIPEPQTRNLQPGISCIRCHAAEDGWRGFSNDVPKILAAGTDIFGDLSSGADVQKQQQLIAGLYGGDWFEAGTGPFAVGRLTYNRAVFRATGRQVNELTATLGQLYNGYAYNDLDVWGVANELGVTGLPASDGNPETDDDVTAACLSLRSFIGAAPVNGVVAREDAVIASVLAGITISRRTWNTAKHLSYERCYQRSEN